MVNILVLSVTSLSLPSLGSVTLITATEWHTKKRVWLCSNKALFIERQVRFLRFA